MGLAIILGLGGLVIILFIFIEPLVHWIGRVTNQETTYRRLEWAINNTLQLQRLAHEGRGFGTWHGAVKECPRTAPGDRLAVLDISDPDHPKLASLPASDEGQAEKPDGDESSSV